MENKLTANQVRGLQALRSKLREIRKERRKDVLKHGQMAICDLCGKPIAYQENLSPGIKGYWVHINTNPRHRAKPGKEQANANDQPPKPHEDQPYEADHEQPDPDLQV